MRRGIRVKPTTLCDSRSRVRKTSVVRTVLPTLALSVVTLFAASGFSYRPDIDRHSQKTVPNYNNAGLNSADVTPTAMVPDAKLSADLKAHVAGVHYAVVIRRHKTLFVGVDTGAAPAPQSVVERVRLWLVAHSAPNTRIYISTNETLVNHFHRYAADRAAHLEVGSDIIMGDIEREFPGVT